MAIGGYMAGKLDKGIDKIIEEKSVDVFNFILKNPWRHNSKKGEKLIRKIKEEGNYKKFIEGHIYENLKTKTIDGKNEVFFIDEIYYPLKLEADKGSNVNIDNIIEIGEGKVINIIGMAGHGKSTLMQKILYETIRKGKRLPIFIELRNLEELTIIEKIKEILDSSGVTAEKEDIESALCSSRLILMLDGFDEISNDKRKKIYQEIDHIKSKLKTPTIVSSRPHTEICKSTIAQEIRIKDLTEEDAINIIEKRMKPEEANLAKEALNKNKTLLKSLITPILVSLFCACYPNSDIIPKTASDYYQRIFNILYEGHDLRKLFFSRQKEFPITIDVARSIFCAFCFLSLKDNKTIMSEDQAIDFVRKSIERCGLTPIGNDTKNCLSDIVKITSLLKEDGFEQYAFIHKSIQEYHTALFIKDTDEDTRESISSSILNGLLDHQTKYLGVANFLHSIDNINTIKRIAIPCFERLGFIEGANHHELAKKILDGVIDKTRAGVVIHTQTEGRNKRDGKKRIVRREIYILKVQQTPEPLFAIKPFLQRNTESDVDIADMIFKSMDDKKYLRYYLEKAGANPDDKPLDDKNSLKLRDVVEHFCLYDFFLERVESTIKKANQEYLEQKNRIGAVRATRGFFSEL